MTSWVANVLATAVGTVPSYALNRRWVWGRDGAGDVWREVVPFWALSFGGLVLSTAAVATADAWASSIGLVGPTRTTLLLLANVGSFAVLWVGQFLVLDRVLFGPTRRGRSRGGGQGLGAIAATPGAEGPASGRPMTEGAPRARAAGYAGAANMAERAISSRRTLAGSKASRFSRSRSKVCSNDGIVFRARLSGVVRAST